MRKNKKYNLAVVGVGVVGIQMLRCLKGRNFPVNELRILARRSRNIRVDGATYKVKAISPDSFNGIDIALFAGTEGEKGAAVTFAPEAIKRGAVVIDNGADFRLKPGVPLVIPEVNARDIKKHKGVIANPNCSTIQMVVALWPLYQKVGIKKVIAATYQAVSGAGRNGISQLESELRNKGVLEKKAFACKIAKNVIPHIGGFGELDYTSEEWKMVEETHKIMHDKKIKISATCVRVPVITGHCEAIYIETRKPITASGARNILSRAKGIRVVDDPRNSLYPLPIDSEGKNEVFIGRVRNTPFKGNGLWLWVVSDNLLKGAALNTVQIAECLAMMNR
ncbi:MAG: aspartate-semialdehyde dehydrogenase [Candidatus Omnitrophota bacterium]